VGMIKPEPGIFKLICDRLGVTAAETVFVDDNPRYYEAAKRLGFASILYTDFTAMKPQLEALLNP
jgi:HAD superfamily hydrolase (TIGR01509 family)